MIITIDGLSATGKTTVARLVAQKLGWHYFDTGAMYRAVTYALLQQKISLGESEKLKELLDNFKFEVRSEDSKVRYFVDSEEVTKLIRTPEVNKKVSEVSAEPAVRELLVALQRDFGKSKKAVFEGRDMGTTVFPEAEVKVFLTARSTVRAERRYKELKDSFPDASEKEVLDNLLHRDDFDASRKTSPLKQADDAHLIDTSDVTLDEVVEHILSLVSRKG